MAATAETVASGPICRLARAKVNLYLHVLGRRPDGYHLLDSLVAFAECGDRLSVVEDEALCLELTGPFAAALGAAMPRAEDNLALRAALSLARAGGVRPRARMLLDKRLPIAGGLGGGSADAAAALLALAELWQLHPAAEDLHALALRLGADVPACLGGSPAFVGGIGEALTPSPSLPPVALLLANPGEAAPTRRVFDGFGDDFGRPARFDAAPANAAALAALLSSRRNQLEPPARRVAPAVDEALARLAALPDALLARMSGSGATCFALFPNLAAAQAAEQALRRSVPGWWLTSAWLAMPEDRGVGA